MQHTTGRLFQWRAYLLIGLFLWPVAALSSDENPYSGTSGNGGVTVATENPLATRIALDAAAQGGNAIDAAVAAALALGVVDGSNSGIGGGCFVLVRWADGRIEAIDGREMAPAAAHRDMYLRNGKPVASLSKSGALASGIPGSLAAFDYILKQGGNKKFPELILPAAELAEAGFPANRKMVQRIGRVADKLGPYPELASLVLDANGKPAKPGHLIVQKDLANTYRALAQEGIDYFYKGDFAKRTAQWMKQNGGIITAEDFANYQLKFRQPVRTSYRGYEVVGFPPPSSGGVHVAQILNMLELHDLASYEDADRAHVLAEAMKLAFADRAYWLGDPDFAGVPRGLVSKAYARELANNIKMDRSIPVPGHSTPKDALSDIFGKHTTHIAAADKAGNWVAITTTLNTSFGSKVIIPGTGVIMNNQMDDFSAQKGVPNAYRLVGQEANSIQPGKRPLSSMSPTIVLKDGKPVLTTGAAGGPTIITQVVQTLVNTIDLGYPLARAVGAPRIHHQWRPDRLVVEERLSREMRRSLKDRGHDITEYRYMGRSQAIGLDTNGNFIAVTEPRLIEFNK